MEKKKLTTDIRRIADELDAKDDVYEGKYYVGFDNAVEQAIGALKAAMFPKFFGSERFDYDAGIKRNTEIARSYDEIRNCLRFVINDEDEIDKQAVNLLSKLPDILEYVKTDVTAAYEGDPAAKSTDEIILTYPAFNAITIYRIAHELYVQGIPVLPRKMTEYAHQMTGIDIHPGATIGKYFFIDHGTGVVIGETTVIGERVKLYQHVTLGAKSFAVGEDGTLVKNIKRHPNIGNNVVIYAGATILGGDVFIGDNSVIGGSVWLTKSVPAGEMVLSTPAKTIHIHNEQEI